MIAHLDVPRFDGRALCAETDPEAFFPVKGGTTRTAKALCNGDAKRDACPVRDECLAWALDRDERDGIWGGLAPRERRAIVLRQRRRPRSGALPPIKHGTEGGYKQHRRRGEDACQACLDGNRLGIPVGAA